MAIWSQPKIDAHCHVLDPQRFPYGAQVAYHPAGQEIGSASYFKEVMDCYGVQHALLVGPNSGYATDNTCLLDAIASSPTVFKGVAVVPNDTPTETLQHLKACGIVGLAFNPSLMGFEHYKDLEPLLRRLQQLDMWAQFQVENNQLIDFLPMLSKVGVKVMIDHCGRPDLAAGLDQPGFAALLALGREGRAVVKLSGFAKFSQNGFPFADARPYVEALVQAFGLQQCIWASDWPYLKAPYRLDYGPLLKVYERMFSPTELHQLMWRSPKQHCGF
jgi:predicted TIM-barrel fold metal-dependent hydrolase